ncbi:MAG TPA: hypothetical protein VMZ91_15630 [Candidatus Paceibacterota bacterium]|nr:hypothetical protein [Candidatus Paceibacterota bacterium]
MGLEDSADKDNAESDAKRDFQNDETQSIPIICIHKRGYRRASFYDSNLKAKCKYCVGFDVTCEDYGTK